MTEAFSEVRLRGWLRDYLVSNIGCDAADIDFNASFSDLGVGSRDAVVLTGELAELMGRSVSPLELWQHPTVNDLIEYLVTPESDKLSGSTDPAVQSWANEPIAVVGMACRFPGDIDDSEAFWQFLCEGRSAVGEVPPDRWKWLDDGSPEAAAVLSDTTRWGSFLSDIDAFDAEFFEISPREAAKIDPQQRLLLEVVYEALEHGGIRADSLRRTQTGVFAGACAGEYGYLASTDLSQVDAWTGTGGALSIIANRVSYFLDLRGPSVTVDTACSSALVAMHLACQSLRTGDSNLAIAAGVNVMLSPVVTRSFDQAQAMSTTGECQAFDAGADGFVRGEGCGAVVLKRLTEALEDGDPVLAVIRGSAVNQDGRSNGLMAPNPAAQMAVLRAACSNAGLSPQQVDYVEANATGTLLGDPIEARALGTVLGRARPHTNPLLIGSVKSNLGHLDAAAGIAGFIKTVLAVQHGHIPANRNFRTPNPHIPFNDLRLKVVDTATDWPATGQPRRAGVSAFGFGGTNAHVLLEQTPISGAADLPTPSGAVTTLVVSGKTIQRVAATAGMLAQWMDGPGAQVALADVAHTLNHHRAQHSKFATVTASERGEAVAGLRALAAGGTADDALAKGITTPHQGECRPGTVFVYPCQHSHWTGVGRQLFVDEPAFAAAVADLEPLIVAQAGVSLQQALTSGEPLAKTGQVEAVVLGIQLALTQLWRSYGVEPDAVIGFSTGEVTAAVVAGALTPADGFRVLAARSALITGLSDLRTTAVLELDSGAVEELISAYPDVTVTVYATPRQTVIAGPPHQVDSIIAIVAEQNGSARRIEVGAAFEHSATDFVLPELRSALADLVPRPPTIPVITTTGAAPVFDADYWAANSGSPVRFSQAVAQAGVDYATFIEVSPDPSLTRAISDTLADVHHHSIGTLARDTHDTVTFHTNLNATHTTQRPDVDHPPEPHPVLPATPWHHTRHWIKSSQIRSRAPQDQPQADSDTWSAVKNRLQAAVSAPQFGTVLGRHVKIATTPPLHLWQASLDPEAMPYPGSYRERGVDVIPASVLLQTLSAVVAECGSSAVSEVRFGSPIVAGEPQMIQVIADGESVTVSSGSATDVSAQRWETNLSAQISPGPHAGSARGILGDDLEIRRYDGSSAASLLGIEGQPLAWSIDACRLTADALHADVVLPEASTVALVDAAVQLGRRCPGRSEVSTGRLLVPAAADTVRFHDAPVESRGAVEVYRREGSGGSSGDELIVDIVVTAPDGRICVEIYGLRYSAVESADTEDVSPDESQPPAWGEMPVEKIHSELETRLRIILARELDMQPTAVDLDRPFPELGLDSTMAMAMLRDAKRLVGFDLSATMLWDHPTISSVATYLSEMLAALAVSEIGIDEAAEQDFSDPGDESESSVLDALFDSVESATAGSESGIG